ncbi:hypothetical protein CNMCM5623_003491 [Aspergillus felis]|uniref:DUF1665 domain protein n=1 Tax=Aspergillus felis TaxID=1287682 RepID=A0A8H6R0C6_9EURO|nr:hypothetical protein CNMCM5623_003491 [Aspergillus felis]KAF7182426.1 hypothetical protein CNMCM7691_001996 [Aspergillus felis]
MPPLRQRTTNIGVDSPTHLKTDTMAPPMAKKRKVLDSLKNKAGRPKKKFRKQLEYHSSSDETEDEQPTDFQAVDLADSDAEEEEKLVEEKPQKPSASETRSLGAQNKRKAEDSDDSSAASDNDSDADGNDASNSPGSSDIEDDEYGDSDTSLPTSTNGRRPVAKRNDPTAFSTSISKILSTKLPTSARADPVLSRSKSAAQTTSELADEKLDKQARAKLRAEKREELDRGRVRDVMGVERGLTGVVAEEEKRLRKIAQRGVVKLFNAVRAAQVRGEEAAREERKKGTVGMGEREKAVNEVSKQGFLELISGKKGKPLNIEEA